MLSWDVVDLKSTHPQACARACAYNIAPRHVVKLILVIILPHFSPVAADELSFSSDEIITNIKPTVFAGLLSGTRKLDGPLILRNLSFKLC